MPSYALLNILPVLLLFVHEIPNANLAFTSRSNRFRTIEVQQKYYRIRTELPSMDFNAIKEGWNKIATHGEYFFDIYSFQEVNNFFIFFQNHRLVGVGPAHKYKERCQNELSTYQQKRVNHSYRLISMLRSLVKCTPTNDLKRDDNVFKHFILIQNAYYKYAVILFVHPAMLKKRKNESWTMANVYFEGRSNLWHHVPIWESEINQATMVKQGCLDKFGYYYFYNLNNKTPCKDVHGFFVFYDNRGLMDGFGAFYTDRDYLWEDVGHPHPLYQFLEEEEIQKIVPNNEKCISSRVGKGYAAINIFVRTQQETDAFVCRYHTEIPITD